MKTLKKWMMMSALAASLFGFAGCALFGGLLSGSSSQQSTEKRGIIYSEQTFGSVKISLEWNLNSARANPLGCYAQNQKTYRISLVAVDNLSEGTSFYFDAKGRQNLNMMKLSGLSAARICTILTCIKTLRSFSVV